jgi:hypothetical protein
MIKEIQNIFKLSFSLLVGAAIFIACEPEADQLGSQFFQNGTAKDSIASYDIVIYNNPRENDTIKSDAGKLTEATLGAFNEPNFGMQKSSYVTQVRLSSYNPDFGTNAVVDSVVLQMKPLYYSTSDSVKTVTYEDYVYPEGNVAAKKVVTTYPVKKYGNLKIGGQPAKFTVNVHEVDEFLDSYETSVYSNKQVTLGTLLGSKDFDGNVRAIKITKDDDNSELYNKEAALRIDLNKNFFQEKIINKKGSFELKDAASFIRYVKGLRISVAENDGFMFNFSPNEITATMYYKYDKTNTDNTVTKTSSTFTFDLGSSNTHFSQINYNRPSSYVTAMSSINKVTGDPKIYLQGMGGPGAEIKVPETVITELKNLYNNQKIAVLSAKVKLYTDATSWSNNYAKPSNFVTLFKETTDNSGVKTTTTSFLDDLAKFQYSGVYKMVNAVDVEKNPAYYEINITQSIKNMIENESTSDKLITLDVGEFRSSTTGLLGKDYTTRAYTPNRIVLVGSDPSNTKYKAQLKVIYSKK